MPSSQQPMLHSISRRPRDEWRATPCAHTCPLRCRSVPCVPPRGHRPRRIAVYFLRGKHGVLIPLAGSVWHRTPIYSRNQGVLCKRPAVFWRALRVQLLGNKAINYWSPENYLCKMSDLASACETKGRPSCWLKKRACKG
jgi:hypothetical protein